MRKSADLLVRSQFMIFARLQSDVLPQAPFDYTDGSADQEISLTRARKTFEEIEFSPNVLRDVSKVDASVTNAGSQTLTAIWYRSNWVYSHDAD